LDADDQDDVEQSDQDRRLPLERSVPRSINSPPSDRIFRPIAGIALGASLGMVLLLTLAALIPPLGKSQSLSIISLSLIVVVGIPAAAFACRGAMKGLYLNRECLAMPGYFHTRRISWNDIADVRSETETGGVVPVIYLRNRDAPKNRVVLKRFLSNAAPGDGEVEVVDIVRDALSKYRTNQNVSRASTDGA